MDPRELGEAYIPIDRRLEMAKGRELPDRMQGAALFADISGFTPLTEALARELGPRRGAEEVTRHLNAVYRSLIAEVDRFRGSVIAFSGDAITCWFDSLPADRALACAFAMQTVMRPFASVPTPSGTAISLAIKIALAAGPVRRFRVGDPRVQYIDVLAGAILDRLSAAEHQARRGEVVVSAEVVTALEQAPEIDGWRDDPATGERFAALVAFDRPGSENPWPDLPVGALPVEVVQPWVLPAIREQLSSGQIHFMAELRPAAAVFCNFGGIDYDRDPDAGAKLDAYVRWTQGVVSDCEGDLLQLTIGDKGSYFYCAFGAPVAHDDDVARAVDTALRLLCVPSHLDYVTGVRIGLGRGRMRTGPYGSPSRCTYGILGDEVNLAARLMSRAEAGQILVSPAVMAAVGNRYRVSSAGTFNLKGKQSPVEAFRVLSQARWVAQAWADRESSALVGREAELEQIAQVARAAAGGKGQVLRLEGPVGIGKSRLAAEMLVRAAALGFRTVSGACQSIAERRAYEPWGQIFRSIMGIAVETKPERDPVEALAGQAREVETLVNRLNPDWALRLPLLGDLLGLPIAENATTAAFEPRMRQSALFDLVVEMILAWAHAQPLLLLIDDVHRMDEASAGLALAVGRAIRQARVLLACLHRPPEPGQSILPELAALPFHHSLRLGELAPQGVAALVAHRLGGEADALALSLMVAETQGNPFFVEEVSRMLTEAGNLVRRDDGGWRLSEPTVQALGKANCLVSAPEGWVLSPQVTLARVELGLPDSIQGVVLSRMDRLPDAPKQTLKVASVVGNQFALNVVGEAHPMRPEEAALRAQAEVLEASDFTRLDTPHPLVYSFKHAVTHDVAYETLLFEQRRELHGAVGLALERQDPGAVEQIAHHAFLGEDWRRGLHYQAAAGTQAQKLFANQPAIEHFRKALLAAEKLSPAETAGQRQQLYASLGQLLAITGKYGPALENLEQALNLAVSLQDRDAQSRACRWISYVHEFRSDYAQALDWIDRGLKVLESRETAATAELLAIAGLINTRQGNYDTALEHCQKCIAVAEKLEDTTALAFAHNARAVLSITQGDSTTAVEHYQIAADLYQQAGNIHGLALSYNGMGNGYIYLGKWVEANTWFRRAVDIFNQTGDALHVGFAYNNLGEIARQQGRLDEALHDYEEALRSLDLVGGSAYLIGLFHMNLGATYIRRAEVELARQHLAVSQEHFTRAGARDFLPELYRYLAEAALLTGAIDEAEARCRDSLNQARELAMRAEAGNALRTLGEIAFARGHLAQAADSLAESISILHEVKHEYEAAQSHLALAKISGALGHPERGLEGLGQCIPTFERLGASLDLAAALALKGSLRRD